jgi:HEAT repeat protein
VIRRCLPLAAVLSLLVLPAIRAQTPPVAAPDTDPGVAQLFALLRGQVKSDADPKKVNELVRLLGSADYERRDHASRDLVAIGRPALERLRLARKDSDLEVSRRAQACIDAIETGLDKNSAYLAVMRLLRGRPAGTAAVLLDYLPEADAETAEEIWQGMTAVAVRDGKVDAAVRAALTDKAPARRALAAFLLGRYGSEGDRAAVRERLTDADAEVRLRAAQGLLAIHDPAAVPALVGLLDAEPLDLAWQAEELLHYLAGAGAPEATLGAGDKEARRKCHADWQAWWQAAVNGFDLARVDREPQRPGLVLVCGPRSLCMYGCDGKVRWEMKDLESPSAVQVIPGPRFLVLEPYLSRATERDAGGKVVWQVKFPEEQYLNAQRLANGNTLIVSDEAFLEYGPDGKLIGKTTAGVDPVRGDIDVGDAVKLRTGTIVVRTHEGVAELDGATGEWLRGGQVANFHAIYNVHMSVLPNGNCLLADVRKQRVVEVDLGGNVLWQHSAFWPVAAEGLPNGNVLVTAQRDGRVYEVTRDGRFVWEVLTTGQPHRARDVFARVRLGFDRPRAEGYDLNSVANRTRNLKDKNAVIRRRAANALAAYGPDAKAAVSALVEALGDGDDQVRAPVIGALVRVGPAAQPALVKAVHHTSPTVREGAWTSLCAMGAAAKPVLPEMVAILRDPKEEWTTRLWSTRVLARMGEEGAEAAPALLEALKGPDDMVRGAAASALPAVGREDADVVPALVAAVKDAKYPQGAVSSAAALRALGPGAAKTTDDLLAVLEDVAYPEGIRCAVALTFAGMGAEAKPAVGRLAKVLKDPRQPEKVRVAVAETLGALGVQAVDGLGALNEILRDRSLPPGLTGEATKALGSMGREGQQVLILLVNEGNSTAKLTAIQILLNQGATAALPALVEAATADDDAEVRDKAAAAARAIQAGGYGKGRGKVMIGD